ncbi:MAG: matrixin family metalloprotease [Myxococcota bacterium]
MRDARSMRAAARLSAVALALAGGGLACASSFDSLLSPPPVARATDRPPPPDRRDYLAFRAAHPDVLEPNYLPFMVHRLPGDGPEGDLLLFCRWDEARMPLAVYVDAPPLPDALQDELRPVAPERFAGAVAGALAIWERELEGLVRFERVDRAADADLRVRLVAARAPAPRPDVLVLGATDALHAACVPQGWDPDAQRQRVRFAVRELEIYLADEFGLLTPGQVERIALHELGHALGMLGHSPDEGDMMFAAYRERSAVETLSQADVDSFVSLYRLPNGAHYGFATPGGPPPRLPPLPPAGAPALAAAPRVDARRGFALRFPEGWVVADTARGAFAANGPVWDYDASIELAVWPYARVEELLARAGGALVGDAWLRRRAPVTLGGRPGVRLVLELAAEALVRDVRLVELGDGRVLMIVVQCPVAAEREWRPWLEASLATLALDDAHGEPGRGERGEHGERGERAQRAQRERGGE